MQHYTFDHEKIFRVYCGHCMLSNPKHRQPDSHACINYTPGDRQENSFVSKEYLGKELLAYMLKLELLPKIEDIT